MDRYCEMNTRQRKQFWRLVLTAMAFTAIGVLWQQDSGWRKTEKLKLRTVSKQKKSMINDCDSLNKTTTTSKQQLTIVTQLSGQLGNHIAKVATAVALALEWQGRPHDSVDIVLRHQEHPKWVAAAADFQACFPHVAKFNVSAANTREFVERLRQLQQHPVNRTTSVADFLDAGINQNPERVDEIFEWLEENWSDLVDKKEKASNATIGFPFVYANHLAGLDVYVDRHYTALRRFFEFKAECCAERPYPDETVFHYRNFLREMPRKGLQKGYQELSPTDVAQKLLAHLPAGSKVALVTRYANDAVAYQHALQQRGLQVRRIVNQTGVQDFCFLMQTQKEAVGLARSTFFWWAAAVLGQADTVRAYSVDSPAKRASGTAVWDQYPWTHPELQRRVKFELYMVD